MTPTIWTYLIVCPLVALAGFVDSVAGGGGVISLPAYLLAGVPVRFAAGTNKLANGCGTAIAAVKYANSGNVYWLAAVPAGIFSLVGSFIGTRIAVFIPENVLEILILAALPAVAILLFLSKGFGETEKPPKGKWATLAISSAIGLGIGCYDGLVGPGTGTFLTLAFSMALGYTLLKSSGCAKIANLASNIASLAVYLSRGYVLFSVGVPAMICSMLGNYLGSRYAIKGGSKKVRFIMFIVLGLLFLKLALNLLGVIDF